ncbi:MAG: carboxypeptidase-like regulatory domain-containing protein [Planctomycetaceae bacterium]|jgi:hypothetical protein|nr:carboxypeptidase-like regulatory domain-containing protein [Planctomycetaceae bacterium]
MRFTMMLISVLFLLVLAVGCSGNMKVSGKVTFSDGTPLTSGEVRFESSGFLASGKIQSDGNYTIGTIYESDGIPNGSYRVSIYALEYPDIPPDTDPADAPSPKSLVAEKFCSAETSGLTCEVNGTTKFDITVEKP